MNPNFESEHWGPYIRWATRLQPQDVVVTFNWDRVLELLASPKLETQLSETKSFALSGAAVPQVLKLHGSVDWRLEGSSVSVTRNPHFAVMAPPTELAIATPGPSKRAATDGYLAPYWERAREALRSAAAVVFLGYRFPPSDAWAREQLLTALSYVTAGEAPGSSRGIKVYSILGPNVGGEDSCRLGGLIRGALEGAGWHDNATGRPPGANPPGNFTLRQLPLYGQDFMSVFSRENLI